jgi:hypothetical protein
MAGLAGIELWNLVILKYLRPFKLIASVVLILAVQNLKLVDPEPLQLLIMVP